MFEQLKNDPEAKQKLLDKLAEQTNAKRTAVTKKQPVAQRKVVAQPAAKQLTPEQQQALAEKLKAFCGKFGKKD